MKQTIGIILLFMLLALLPACARHADLEAARQFQAAQTQFDEAQTSEDYLTAAGSYQQLIDAGWHCAPVYFNQGNAFMRAGETGRAIAAYRMATRYDPRDPYIQANLQSAITQTTATPPRVGLMSKIVFWQDRLSYPEKFQLLLVLAIVAVLFGLINRWRSGRPARLIVMLALAGAILVGISATYDVYRFDLTKHGVITANETIARKGNDESYQPAFTESLPMGSEFIVLEQRGDWLRIRISRAGEGWVPAGQCVTY